MPRGKGYGRSHGKHSRQMGISKGGGRRKTKPTSDRAQNMTSKDPSTGKQRRYNDHSASRG